jgi:hypothetical protein
MNTSTDISLRNYVRIMGQLLTQPRVFFSTLPLDLGVKRPMLMLIVSSAVYVAACLMSRRPADPLAWGGVLFANAIGMAMITAVLGFGVMLVTRGKQVSFGPFFSVYALSNSAVLLVAWIPFAGLITELFKWWLIGTGLIRSFGLKMWQSAVIVGVSVLGVVVIFQSVLSVLGTGSG